MLYNAYGKIDFGKFSVYLAYNEPPRQIYFVLSEGIQGWGTLCENRECGNSCPKSNCSGKLKMEISELVCGKEIVKTCKLSYAGEGRFWIWFSPGFKRLFTKDKNLCLEILSKEKMESCGIILQWLISETQEVLGSFNITENLKFKNRWNIIEIPLGIGGFEINQSKVTKSGTLTLEIKILSFEENREIKGNLYLRSLSIK